ncbi:FRG domain-containing protein [Candidatus Pacearchaeota archaeon]|nr:FRG domain-containing protein [Candidatus Pacearchaeota archaeon]
MSRTKRWRWIKSKDGVGTIQLSHWKYFHDYLRQEMLEYSHYVWRGDRCDNRSLLASLDREYASRTQKYIEDKFKAHLRAFKLACRGRRGNHPSILESENDWWALGQHYGLNTPLLDWTRSAFVALFFAFEKVKQPQTTNRVVYAVCPGQCEMLSPNIKVAHTGDLRPDIVEFLSPLQDDNSRLVNQNGLFSRCTAGKHLDKWIQEKFPSERKAILLKIQIPDKGRTECLRTLNKMNINYLTLFPDIYGASNHVNMSEKIKQY